MYDYFFPPDSDDPGAYDPPQREIQDLLRSLVESQKISEDCHNCGLQLVEDASGSPEYSEHLRQFLQHLKKSLTHKPESSEATGGSAAGFGFPFGFRSPKAKVFIHVSGETHGAHKPIKNKLKSKLNVVKNLHECDVVVLFCPISSRVGSDVAAALKDMSESVTEKPVVLVLMHHTRNIYYSSDETDWSTEYPAVASHVHVLFHDSQKGLLMCPKNDQAIQSLLEQCNKHAK